MDNAVEAAVSAAIPALFSYWRAVVRRRLSTIARRSVSMAIVDRKIAALGMAAFIEPAVRELRFLEHETGKKYSEWTSAERIRGGKFVSDVLNSVRTSAFERSRGRPVGERRIGLIAGAMLRGDRQRASLAQSRIREIKRKLPRLVKLYKLGVWSTVNMPPRSTMLDAERSVEKKQLWDEVNSEASEKEAVRQLLCGTGNEDLEQRLRQHLSRRRKRLQRT